MKVRLLLLLLILGSSVSAQPTLNITRSGVGPIRVGMTLGEARKAAPSARFQREVDAAGVSLVAAVFPGDQALLLWADDDGDDVDWSKRIRSIETFDTGFRTAEGIRVGSPIADVEKRFGRVVEIVESEIESRQYVTFARQPAFLTFRLDYTGIFERGKRPTTAYEKDAKILSITVSAN